MVHQNKGIMRIVGPKAKSNWKRKSDVCQSFWDRSKSPIYNTQTDLYLQYKDGRYNIKINTIYYLQHQKIFTKVMQDEHLDWEENIYKRKDLFQEESES